MTPVLTDILEGADYRNAYSLQFRCYGHPVSTTPQSIRSYMICMSDPLPDMFYGLTFSNLQAAQTTCAVLLAQDILVIGLTLAKTFGQWWEARKLKMTVSMSASILRGGTIHFLILMSLLIAQMCIVKPDGIMEMVMAPLLAAMPLILTSRLIMELRAMLQGPSDLSDPGAGQRQTYFHRSAREVQRSLNLLNTTSVGRPVAEDRVDEE
ncbi:hypothetical protein PsYK624_014400 [Phanerochaete sordida]|uniref:Uncharacterized protein n=1 Tax=Phanerochaete sordida TaxID=48140 RepID=A0A9P3L7R9_9APHY|nr:hypothetical protein PsYK624_014400 [Phanerochaete sordida]